MHEAGHALVAVLVGRRLSGIRLHSDTSGLTVSRGKPRGPGMVAMLAAGYLAPALLGLLAAFLLGDGRGVGLLWLLVLLLAGLLVWVRNGYGLLVVLLGGARAVRPHLVGLCAGTVGRGVPRRLAAPARRTPPAGRAARARPPARGVRPTPTSSPTLTHVPAVVWILVLLAANCAGLVLGVGMLAPELV